MKKMRTILHDILGKNLTPAEVLKGARIEAGISQEQMSEITGIKRSNISALENGRIQITAHYAEIFAAALQIHPANILYPNGEVLKTKEILLIEKKAAKILASSHR